MIRDYQKIEGAIRKIFSDSLEFPGKGGGRHTYWGEDGQDGYGDEDDDDGQPDYWYDPETWQAIYFEEEDIFEDLLEMDQEGQAYMVLQDPHGLIGEETLAQHGKCGVAGLEVHPPRSSRYSMPTKYSRCLLRWRRCLLRLWLGYASQAIGALQEVIRQPRLREARILGMGRDNVPSNCSRQKVSRRCDANGGHEDPASPGRWPTTALCGTPEKNRGSGSGAEAIQDVPTRHHQPRGQRQLELEQVHELGAIEMIPKIGLERMNEWVMVLIFRLPDYVLPQQKKGKKQQAHLGEYPSGTRTQGPMSVAASSSQLPLQELRHLPETHRMNTPPGAGASLEDMSYTPELTESDNDGMSGRDRDGLAMMRQDVHNFEMDNPTLTQSCQHCPGTNYVWNGAANCPFLFPNLDHKMTPAFGCAVPSGETLHSDCEGSTGLRVPELQDFTLEVDWPEAAGTRQDIIDYVLREFQCSGCQLEKRPATRLPSGTPRTFDFNVVIGVDVLILHGVDNKTEHPVLNVTCCGTLYSTFGIIDVQRRTAALTWKAFALLWLRTFGAPEYLIDDQGNEFVVGQKFQDGLEHHGICPIEINRDAPYENGVTERRGGHIKDEYYRTRELRPSVKREIERQVFQEGEPVMIWRQGTRGSLAKVGPCLVVIQKGHDVGVTRRDELHKCNVSQVFPIGNLERQGLECIPLDLLQAKERLRHDSEKLQYIDISQENDDDDHDGGEMLPSSTATGAVAHPGGPVTVDIDANGKPSEPHALPPEGGPLIRAMPAENHQNLMHYHLKGAID
eukprot:s510_g13.t1